MIECSTLPSRALGDGLTASAVSFGAMGMSEFYGTPPDDAASLTVLDRALELGITMYDTADMYGRGHNERLLAAFLARHPAERAQGRLRVATKVGIDRDPVDGYKRNINNDPTYLRKSCEASLQRLGLERIDLYYIHRINPQADILMTMDTLAALRKEGKIAHVGLCEVSATVLEKAHAAHPVAVVQSEYSLWTREVEQTVLPACRRLGIGFVAYSPLGRGFLTGKYASTENLEPNDFRRSSPRFQAENLCRNLQLLPTLQAVAARHGRTPAQTALAWLLGRYDRLVVIPGTRNIARLEENCAATRLTLTNDDLAQLDAAFTPQAVYGARYPAEGMKGTNA